MNQRLYTLVGLILFLLPSAQLVFSGGSNKIALTVQEQEWIKQHPVIRLGISGSPSPISFWSGAPLSSHPSSSPFFSAPPQNRIDKAAGPSPLDDAQKSPHIPQHVQRSEQISYYRSPPNATPPFNRLRTESYIKVPVVIVTRNDVDYIEDLNQLDSMHVAGVLSIGRKLEQLGLPIDLIHLGPAEGIRGVSTGKYDAFICELTGVSQVLSEIPLTNIKISGELPTLLFLPWSLLRNIKNWFRF